jgi:hypothetical protein
LILYYREQGIQNDSENRSEKERNSTGIERGCGRKEERKKERTNVLHVMYISARIYKSEYKKKRAGKSS